MDDEQPVRTLMVRDLQDAGCHVTVAATGVEAVTQFRAAWEHAPRFDEVILDLTMRGGIGGANVLRQLRGIDPPITANVVSQYTSNPVMSGYRQHGCNGVVSK